MMQLIFLPVLVSILLIYFKLAGHFNILDTPNHRSSHKHSTIRGGGIIFPIAVFLYFVTSDSELIYFVTGLVLISSVSFYDDINPLPNIPRVVAHLISVSLLFYQADLFGYPIWMIAIGYFVVIGAINAYNFMDGINGITGGYSLITILTLWYVNNELEFVDGELIVMMILVLLTFNYFNFRTKAKCFAGDVGSVSIAFIILFFILLLMIRTGEFKYIGFLLFYGLDSTSTIMFRIIRKENIFQAHRSHFYQSLANNRRTPHLIVSALYMFVQLSLNIFITQIHLEGPLMILFFLGSAALFIAIRYSIEGKRLLHGGLTISHLISDDNTLPKRDLS